MNRCYVRRNLCIVLKARPAPSPGQEKGPGVLDCHRLEGLDWTLAAGGLIGLVAWLLWLSWL